MGEVRNYELWERLTFKTTNYGKNFDLISDNDSFISECDGDISEVRIDEDKPSFIVGEYCFSIWNLGLAREFGVDLLSIIDDDFTESAYTEIYDLINNKEIDLSKTDKLIIIHTMILHPKYKNKGVFDEFIEYIYSKYYWGGNNKLLALVKPVQTNEIDLDYYQKKKNIEIKQKLTKDSPVVIMHANEYYGIDELLKKDDDEHNEYKLYAHACKSGFNRIGDTHIFEFKPEHIRFRMEEKRSEHHGTMF